MYVRYLEYIHDRAPLDDCLQYQISSCTQQPQCTEYGDCVADYKTIGSFSYNNQHKNKMKLIVKLRFINTHFRAIKDNLFPLFIMYPMLRLDVVLISVTKDFNVNDGYYKYINYENHGSSQCLHLQDLLEIFIMFSGIAKRVIYPNPSFCRFYSLLVYLRLYSTRQAYLKLHGDGQTYLKLFEAIVILVLSPMDAVKIAMHLLASLIILLCICLFLFSFQSTFPHSNQIFHMHAACLLLIHSYLYFQLYFLALRLSILFIACCVSYG